MTTPEDLPIVFTGCDAKPAPGPGLQVHPWICPLCKGTGRWSGGERCMQCTGFGLLEEMPDPEVWGEPERARRPTGVQPRMCKDCAFRPGAPEEDQQPPADTPFYCHQSTHATERGYTPVVTYNGLPIGERICAGWWQRVTGQGEEPENAAPFTDTHPHKAFGTREDPQ